MLEAGLLYIASWTNCAVIVLIKNRLVNHKNTVHIWQILWRRSRIWARQRNNGQQPLNRGKTMAFKRSLELKIEYNPLRVKDILIAYWLHIFWSVSCSSWLWTHQQITHVTSADGFSSGARVPTCRGDGDGQASVWGIVMDVSSDIQLLLNIFGPCGQRHGV